MGTRRRRRLIPSSLPGVAHYLTFVVFAGLVALAPGPDTFVVLRGAVVGGRSRGLWTTGGITAANVLQGLAVATGLSALLTSSAHVFTAVRWAGVLYLAYLGVGALRSALRAGHDTWSVGSMGGRASHWTAARQGFLSNITNPKVLAFNLAVLPQFAGPHAGFLELMGLALTLTLLGLLDQVAVVFGASAVAQAIRRSGVRRGIEGATGLVMFGFAGALAADAA